MVKLEEDRPAVLGASDKTGTRIQQPKRRQEDIRMQKTVPQIRIDIQLKEEYKVDSQVTFIVLL